MNAPLNIPRIKPVHGTLLVLHQGGRLLLIRRAKEPYKGYLALPGGKMEEGEAPLEAARREMYEETGLRKPRPIWLGRVTDLLVEGPPPFRCFVLDVFEAKLPKGVVSQPSFEGAIVRMPLAELADREKEIIPADVVILRRFVVERSTTQLDLLSIPAGDGYEVKVL